MTSDHTYVKPVDVHAPKRHWTLLHVLFDGGPATEKNESPSSLAIGRWDNNPVLAMRWNGNDDNPIGNPQSRGLPTWFVIPDQHWKAILESDAYKSISADTLTVARNFLDLKRVYFMSPCPNPSCPNYGGPVLSTFRPNQIEEVLAELERNEFELYHIICNASWKPGSQEKADLATVLKAGWENHRLHSEVKVMARLLEDGMIECFWSKRADGRLYLYSPGKRQVGVAAPSGGLTPIDEVQFQSQLKAIGCGASDDQLDMVMAQLRKSCSAELWIPQSTSKVFTFGRPV